MYTLNTTAIGVLNGVNKRWQDIDITSISVQNLLAQYRIVQITLMPDNSTTPVYLLSSDLVNDYSTFTGTVQDLLNQPAYDVPTHPTALKPANDVAHFYDALSMRYRLMPVDQNNIIPPATPDVSSVDNLRLDRFDTLIEASVAVTQVLPNINGFYHLPENIGDQGIVVKDGFKSLRHAGQTQVGLWDFTELGGFSILPTIPGELVEAANAYQVLLSQDLSDKTVFFVIAGYFFPVDGTVIAQNGAGMFYIDFANANMQAVARYYEAMSYIDMSSVAAAAAGSTPGTIDPTLLTSQAAITAWLALSQSFVVIVNRAETYLQSRSLQRTGKPSRYFCYLDRANSVVMGEVNNVDLSPTPPQLPLVLVLGRHPPYWTTTEGWTHTLTIYNNRIGELLYAGTTGADAIASSGAYQPGAPGHLQAAYFLEFGSNIVG